MLFNSYEFLFAFLPLVFLIFFALGKKSHRAAASFLGFVSLVFYAWFSIKALPILIGSIIINYLCGIKISAHREKNWLIAAIIFNLGLLSFFKYANFFIDNTNALLNSLQTINALDVALPIGISFFTFTQIAFLVDCYQGKVKEKNFTHYLLFVTYFPHLIAGPVLHHTQMMPQFAKKETYSLDYEKIALGILIFTIGLAKKILIANPLAEYADSFFDGIDASSSPSFANAWLGTIAYTFQIYFDFSGYTDMAIGISLLFGIHLPINFNAPYQATNIIEFWRRWHISLSNFLRDYLYIPLGGNKKGVSQRYINLLITMILGGFWHGANWTFVLWGLAHGILLSWNHYWRSFTISQKLNIRFLNPIFWSLTFIAICFTWVLFRVDDVEYLKPIYFGLLGLHGFDNLKLSWAFAEHLQASRLYELLATSFLIIYLGKPSHLLLDHLRHWHQRTMWLPTQLKFNGFALIIFLFMMYCINMVGNYNPFLYFQF